MRRRERSEPECREHLGNAFACDRRSDPDQRTFRVEPAVEVEGEKVTAEDIKRIIADFVPPSYPLEIELQNLAAVQECTSRELLPENFRRLDRDVINTRIRELKTLLEER